MDFCINPEELKEKSVQIILEKDESEKSNDADDTYKVAAIYIPE